MADVKITDLPDLGSSAAAADVLAIVDDGAAATKKVSLTDLFGNVPVAISTSSTVSGSNLSGTNTGDEAAASLTVAGVIEIATVTETNTGTDATRAVSPDGLDGWTGSSQVTTVGTVASGTWQGTAINQTYLVGQSGTNTGDEVSATLTVEGIVERSTSAENVTGTDDTVYPTVAGTKEMIDTHGGGGDALTSNPLSQFAATTSLQLKGVMSDETGSGLLVFATSPTFTTPILGVASATSLATSAAIPLLLTNGQLVNVALTSQTVGATTLTIPDFASVVDEFTFKTKAQTLANKTLTTPTIGSFTNAAHDHSNAAGGGSVVAASDSVAGVIELATDNETNTGTATDRATTPANIEAWTGSAQLVTVGALTGVPSITMADTGALRTTVTATDTMLIQARDVDGSAYTTFITLTAANTPTCVFSGDITSTTQSPADNSTKLATTAYADAAAGAGGAAVTLANLAGVALNTALLPDAAAADDFGSATLPFKDLWFAGSSGTPGTNNFQLTGASTSGTRVITVPDATDTLVGKATTDAFTNKTYDANGTGNVLTNIDIGNCIAASQAEAEAGSDNTKMVTSLRVAEAIAALAGGGGGFTLATPQATTSGTSFNFGSLPAGITQIVVMFFDVSMDNATDRFLVQIGDSGGIETSGYLSTSTSAQTSTAGFIIEMRDTSRTFYGHMILTLQDSTNHNWVETHGGVKASTILPVEGSGSKSLSAELTQVTVTRTDSANYNSGSVNIMYI